VWVHLLGEHPTEFECLKACLQFVDVATHGAKGSGVVLSSGQFGEFLRIDEATSDRVNIVDDLL